LGAVDLSPLGATTATFPNFSGSGSLILPTGGIMSIGGDNSSTSFFGVISGTVEFRKSGTGSFTLQAQNNYSGATEIAGGTIKLATNNALPTSTYLTSASTGTLDLAGFNQTIAD